MPTVPLSRDFLLWLYRDRTRLSWAALERQPAWRTDRDLAYIQLEALARAWGAAEAVDAAEHAQKLAEARANLRR